MRLVQYLETRDRSPSRRGREIWKTDSVPSQVSVFEWDGKVGEEVFPIGKWSFSNEPTAGWVDRGIPVYGSQKELRRQVQADVDGEIWRRERRRKEGVAAVVLGPYRRARDEALRQANEDLRREIADGAPKREAIGRYIVRVEPVNAALAKVESVVAYRLDLI